MLQPPPFILLWQNCGASKSTIDRTHYEEGPEKRLHESQVSSRLGWRWRKPILNIRHQCQSGRFCTPFAAVTTATLQDCKVSVAYVNAERIVTCMAQIVFLVFAKLNLPERVVLSRIRKKHNELCRRIATAVLRQFSTGCKKGAASAAKAVPRQCV